MKRTKSEIRAWTSNDSAELYQVPAWGAGFFDVSEDGQLTITSQQQDPSAQSGAAPMPLLDLVEDLDRRGYETPILLRFSNILKERIQGLWQAFENAAQNAGYTGKYRGVYPIKVNQERHVVEEMVAFGRDLGLGLEAGSKPELLIALALVDTPNALLICNGYKDQEYIEMALLSQKLGRNTLIVVDRYAELDLIIAASKRLGIRPQIGFRAKLAAKGAGKWIESAGELSKFGLSSAEMVRGVDVLRKADMLDCLKMLHFHIGSQITAIRAVKDAMREGSRIYVELCKMGAPLAFVDVGGGLAVDYDGSQTNFHSSSNYSLAEYASAVVDAMHGACGEAELPHPHIVTESGRALVAHHSMLVFNILGTHKVHDTSAPKAATDDEAEMVHKMWEIHTQLTQKNFLESYHNLISLKEQAVSLFNLGYLDLSTRGRVEALFWTTCDKIRKITHSLEYVPEELEGLDRAMCDTYYGNFSVFQSAPDHWAVKQLFPVMPIHRLDEKPTRRGVLVDLTCDSDGKIDAFIDRRDVKDVLELHPLQDGKPYYVGIFLLGAYQEILGDLHNLFGDTTAIHVSLDADHGYSIEAVVEGDSVSEVLGYVQYDRTELLRRLRTTTEAALRHQKLTLEESALFRRRYEAGLAGYTYHTQKTNT